MITTSRALRLPTPDARRDTSTRAGRSAWVAATLVLLVHALLWLLFDTSQRVAASRPATELIRLRLIAEPARPQARPDPGPPAQAGLRMQTPSSAPLPAPSVAATIPPGEPLTTAAQTAASAAPQADTAAAPAPRATLLDNEATRRAVLQAARDAPLTAAAPAETASQRLGRKLSENADGDCLKGEYAGAGMGLLSAPFWLLAEARGKCRR
jgi:type IV secretory pathway VirB10-like protein